MATPHAILHVDMDAFYASIEQRDHPEWRGQPLIVGGQPNSRGVVAAASYEARAFGVHSAMPASRAFRLCPRAIVVPPRIGDYAVVGRQVREILHRFTPLVEPLSLDEAFLDVTGSLALFGSAEAIARSIKQSIRDELQLVASVGVAPNKFLAKIASDLQKPDGLTVVPTDDIEGFLAPLSIRRLWGVGQRAEEKLAQCGVTTIGQMQQLRETDLVSLFGEKGGQHLFRLSRGCDERAVVPDQQAISISHETTFANDVTSRDVLLAVLRELTEQVARRLRRQAARAGSVQLKIRYSDFQTLTRSSSFSESTDVTRDLWLAVKRLFLEKLPARPLEIRLIGMGVHSLDRGKTVQKSLFSQKTTDKERQLDAARDAIADKFGRSAIQPGSVLGSDDPFRGRDENRDDRT